MTITNFLRVDKADESTITALLNWIGENPTKFLKPDNHEWTHDHVQGRYFIKATKDTLHLELHIERIDYYFNLAPKKPEGTPTKDLEPLVLKSQSGYTYAHTHYHLEKDMPYKT